MTDLETTVVTVTEAHAAKAEETAEAEKEEDKAEE